MAAEIFASSLTGAVVQQLIGSLSKIIEERIGLILGVEEELHRLSNTLATIQRVLEDAEERRFQSHSIQHWLARLSGLAFEIEDLLDDCNTEVMKVHHRGGPFNLKKLVYKYKIGERLKKAVRSLDALASDRHRFHLVETTHQLQQHDWRRETGSVVTDPESLRGRDDEKEMIVQALLNQAPDHRLSVLPIVGIGGLGKTTLAQLIFNDDRVSAHFGHKVWVCVSDTYDLKFILRSIVKCVADEHTPDSLESLDSLQRQINLTLKNKNFLLVLDDVWNDNQEDWAMLRSILDCVSSSIIVTTRQQKVAEIMGTFPAVWLSELTEDECWLLMKERASGGAVLLHPNLEAIGRRIAKKCGGLPLAAKALGGLLRFKRAEEEWLRVEQSHMWDLPQDPNSILPSLKLSYQHLPSMLKKCYAYCALFPKDHKHVKGVLIFHWMAHGCIPSSGTQQPEDIAGEVWDELLLRSLLRLHGAPILEGAAQMHDLVHDLAVSIMENKIHANEAEGSSTGGNGGTNRRIRQVYSDDEFSVVNSSIVAHVSTADTIMKYPRARAVDLSGLPTCVLPSRIHKLKLLRSLNLSSTSISTFPRKFHRLPNLEILILSKCIHLINLPKKLRRMTSLRHILLDGCGSLSHMPSRIGELSSLKTLDVFVVSDKEESGHLNELEHLSLEGRLEIQNLEMVQGQVRANLVRKPKLRVLDFSWDSETSLRRMEDGMLLEALEPHPNLTNLAISGFRGIEFAPWVGTMNNLTDLDLADCVNCTRLPPISHLPRLVKLWLCGLDLLEYIVEVNAERVMYASLEELHLRSLPNLKGWLKAEEEGVVILPNLQFLSIGGCPMFALKSTSFGGLNSLNRLYLADCKVEGCLAEEVMRQLIALESLHIEDCTGLADVQFQHLRLLKFLTLSNSDDMVVVPQAIQHLPSLQTLGLYSLTQLAVLPDWLPNLISLNSLEIQNCQQIPSLPSCIQDMASIKNLRIIDCPTLEARCDAESGEDWHKIAHIPDCRFTSDVYGWIVLED